MKYTVGVADMKVAWQPDDTIITHALGSCLGIAIHDPMANVGGMLHVMLPLSSMDPPKAAANPFMFVDSGVPALFREAYAAGAAKNRLRIKVAGGASIGNNGEDRFAIGKRNYIALKKLLWQNGVLIDKEEVGGNIPRTLHLDVGSGRVWISTAGEVRDL